MKVNIIVSDAGPLIGLARIGKLKILKKLFEKVYIPEAVYKELAIESGKEGAKILKKEVNSDWIIHEKGIIVPQKIQNILDLGESEAIVLAQKKKALLLIDEKKGRKVAAAEGVSFTGTGALLIRAKQKGYITSVKEALNELINEDYRFSETLIKKILKLAGE